MQCGCRRKGSEPSRKGPREGSVRSRKGSEGQGEAVIGRERQYVEPPPPNNRAAAVTASGFSCGPCGATAFVSDRPAENTTPSVSWKRSDGPRKDHAVAPLKLLQLSPEPSAGRRSIAPGAARTPSSRPRLAILTAAKMVQMAMRCVVRDANMLAGRNSSWCPKLESQTTPADGPAASDQRFAESDDGCQRELQHHKRRHQSLAERQRKCKERQCLSQRELCTGRCSHAM